MSLLSFTNELENPVHDYPPISASSMQHLLLNLYKPEVTGNYYDKHTEKIKNEIKKVFDINNINDNEILKDCDHYDRKFKVGIQSNENNSELLNDVLKHLALVHPGEGVIDRIISLLSLVYTEYSDYKGGIVFL